jgi:hypothetical protein
VQIKLDSPDDIPTDVVLTFGDAIHNLRAALDHVIGEAVLTLDPSVNPGEIYFPLKDTRNGVIGALTKGPMKKAMETAIGKRLCASILDEIKPYGSYDVPIRALGKLDNIDKHRLVIAVLVPRGVSFSGSIGTGLYANCLLFSYGGPKGYTVISADEGVKGDMKPALDVLIDEAQLLKGHSVVPTLIDLSKVVSQSIEAMERCFLIK